VRSLLSAPPAVKLIPVNASQLYLDHSLCPVLAPGRADLHALAALLSTRAISQPHVFYVAASQLALFAEIAKDLKTN
jgi:hypothetical protein